MTSQLIKPLKTSDEALNFNSLNLRFFLRLIFGIFLLHSKERLFSFTSWTEANGRARRESSLPKLTSCTNTETIGQCVFLLCIFNTNTHKINVLTFANQYFWWELRVILFPVQEKLGCCPWVKRQSLEPSLCWPQ